ncbi:MAG TPA: hypothetical protein VI731_03680, partial [Bacteroidia bacterium]|nr:hypothetical protein [Bacteroidia bacterium]
QLDASGNIYDYSGISTTGKDDVVKGELENLWDGDFETTTMKGGPQWSFMPSAGIGFGYQWGNGFALGVEHRTTWALNDFIDGVNHDYTGALTPDNDLYHYDGFFIRWTFGGRSKSKTTNNPPPPPPTNQTYTPPPPTNTVVTTPPPNNPNPDGNQAPVVQPPNVRFTAPGTEPYTTNVQMQQLVVRIDNVSYSSQVSLTINNQPSNNFSFNPNTHTMSFTHTLIPGNNTYRVNASNSAGSASDLQTIIYKPQSTPVPNPPMPPQVTITMPAADPFTATTQTMTVYATVLNVTASSNIQVRHNSSPVTNFTFNPSNSQVSFMANLQNGNNLYEVIGTNTAGSASDAVTIIYNPAPAMQPPVVTITTPGVCPATVKLNNLTITANITNVTLASQVSVVFNKTQITNFSFTAHGTFATISFPVMLVPGINPFTITASNAAGTNSKSCDVTLNITTTPTALPPVVTITNPGRCPASVKVNNLTITATITNVTMASQVSVVFNNVQITNFTFVANSSASATITFPVVLLPGINPFTVTGTNSAGTNSKSCDIDFNVTTPPPVLPPVVTITNPPGATHSSQTQAFVFMATVLNVAGQNEITCQFNGRNITGFLYNLTTKVLTYNATLVNGNNTFTVSASNANGNDSKSATVVYVVITPPTIPPPTVNITVPAASPFPTLNTTEVVVATVMNVSQASQVTVIGPNKSAINFNFSATQHTVTFTTPALTIGNNLYTVTATNPAGSANDFVTIVRDQPLPPPTVNITTPATNPFATLNATVVVVATVMNVSQSSQVNVTGPNNATVNFNFNAALHTVTFTTPSLLGGNNLFTVTATNSVGSANDFVTIVRDQGVPIPKPTVNITVPAANPFNTTNTTETVVATVMNVSSSSQVSVKGPNKQAINFNFSATAHTVTFTTPTLIMGNNTFTVTATNQAGTASDNTVIKRITPPTGNAPQIALVNPSSSNSASPASSIPVTMQLTNVSSASQITVRVNNVVQTGFTFTAGTGLLVFTASLIQGANTIEVTAQTSAGTATKSITVNYGTAKTTGGGKGSKPKPGAKTTKTKSDSATGGRGGTKPK